MVTATLLPMRAGCQRNWSDIIDVNGDGEINIADANVIIDNPQPLINPPF